MSSSVASPASATEALEMLESAMDYLSVVDAPQLGAETQAACLAGLERLDAVETVARALILSAFTAGRGFDGDGAYNARAWLIHHTRITRGAAAGHVGWSRRAEAHPEVMAALARRDLLSESVAKKICLWTDRLPGECRDAADAILVGAVKAGMDVRDLAGLAAEIIERSRPDEPDPDRPGETFEDRSLKLESTFDGAAVLRGDLTPECGAVVTAVLDALSAPCGAGDTRSHEQRYHDGLAEAMKRLIASGLLPERAGQPVKVMAHITLADLMVLDGNSALQDQWIANARAAWAAHRARASEGGGDGGAWLDGDAAQALACDASVTPVVIGDVNVAALDGLVELCVELARIQDTDDTTTSDTVDATAVTPDAADAGVPAGLRRREALEQAIIGQAIKLVSGPGGLASFLRRQQLGARLAGPSLPLDVGVSRDIPAAIRRAVILRAQHCEWAGGCDQPAAACEVHHVTHRAHGGKTSVTDCKLYCTYHHQVVIHRMGWTITALPDGTTTARSPDGTKVLRSHSPPPLPG